MFRSWSPCIPAFTRAFLESHHPKNLFPACLCFVGWSGLLAPSTFECSKMVGPGRWAHACSFLSYFSWKVVTVWWFLPRSNISGSCGCTWTPFKEVLFSRTLCVSFLVVLIFFLIRTLDFHVWWRLSADCLCSSIFSVSKMKPQPTWHMEAEALKAFLLQTCLGWRIKARVSTCLSQTFPGCMLRTKGFVNQFVNLVLRIAISGFHMPWERSGWTPLDLVRQGRHTEAVRLLEDAESWLWR